jgi:hypothetical protein
MELRCLSQVGGHGKLEIILLFHRKLIHCRRLIRLTRPQHDRRKLRLVDRIGKVLCFQAEAALFFVDGAAFAFGVAHEIRGVELDAGLGGVCLHNSAGFWFVSASGEGQLAAAAV